MDSQQIRAVAWEAPQHHHIQKSSEWYWMLGIVGAAAAVAAIVFGNILFAAVILLAVSTMFIFAHHEPRIIPFEVTYRGVRIDDVLYPYTALESFYIDEDAPLGPQLLLKSEKIFSPLLILPLPEDSVEEIDDILAERLEEEHLEEPLSHRILEFFGF